MANAEALKKRKSNLPPPPVDEVSENIHPRQAVDSASYERTDARSFRRTGRTIQFNIRVTPAFDMLVRDIAQRERRTLAEVLELALALYDQKTIG
jgi:hypothetical protein